jgi:lipoprotein-anchoring transpeptidase ErfK/SrfK
MLRCNRRVAIAAALGRGSTAATTVRQVFGRRGGRFDDLLAAPAQHAATETVSGTDPASIACCEDLGAMGRILLSLRQSLAAPRAPARRARPRRRQGTPSMSASIRHLLMAGLAAVALATPALAQGRGPVGDPGIDGGYDENQLYQDQNGNLYLKRGGRYVPYRGNADLGRPAPGSEAPPPPARSAERPAREETPIEKAKARVIALPPDNTPIDYARAYAAIPDDVYPVQAFNYKKMNPAYLRQEIAYTGPYEPGTIVVDPRAHQLTLVEGNGRARRYGVGVGKQGFAWSGAATINSKQAWPDWYPPKEMIARRPDLAGQIDQLQSGVGVPGGTRNPLGARAMYLWQNNKDTLFRIHGTTEPETIGRSVSSGCIRMINQDAIDLFSRVNVGTKVVVLN